MRYIKQFEERKNTPKVGDYVICTDKCDDSDPKRTEFVNNHVGRIVSTENELFNELYPIRVIYEKNLPLPYENHENEYICSYEEILFCSKDKEEVEVLLYAKKYNL